MSPRYTLFAAVAGACASVASPVAFGQSVTSAPPSKPESGAVASPAKPLPTVTYLPSGQREPVRREVQPRPRRNVVTTAEPPAGTTGDAAAAKSAGAAQSPLPTVSSPSTPGSVSAATAPAAGAVAPQPVGWTAQEIADAKAHCAAVLKGIDATYEHEEPIKSGECGAPAVVQVSSVAKVALNPPATLTCDMVVSLHKWFKTDVQPAARTQLGGPIVKVETMSSYSCRNAYGRARTNLSEHGRANALDIGGFATASGDTTRVLASWGLTQRDIRALAKAEQEKAAKAAAQAAAARHAQPPANGSPVVTGSTRTDPPSVSSLHSGSIPGVIVREPILPGLGGVGGFGFAPNRLGGPKQPQPASVAPPAAPGARGGHPPADPAVRRTKFLHEIHAAACKHFGTVLGPEANAFHKNHFHVDMAPRRGSNFCE